MQVLTTVPRSLTIVCPFCRADVPCEHYIKEFGDESVHTVTFEGVRPLWYGHFKYGQQTLRWAMMRPGDSMTGAVLTVGKAVELMDLIDSMCPVELALVEDKHTYFVGLVEWATKEGLLTSNEASNLRNFWAIQELA
jgi:hypothetical protein